MKNETLSHILSKLELDKCKEISNNVYYIKKDVQERIYSPELGKYKSTRNKYEFLVVAENEIKKAIILNCDNSDLHWYVFKKFRGQHVLSSILRSGVIKRVWPEIKKVSCCYEWNEDKDKKYKMTKYLASLANLELKE